MAEGGLTLQAFLKSANLLQFLEYFGKEVGSEDVTDLQDLDVNDLDLTPTEKKRYKRYIY